MTQLSLPADLGAIVFDKDGTLIDFNAMWATWLTGGWLNLSAATAWLANSGRAVSPSSMTGCQAD